MNSSPWVSFITKLKEKQMRDFMKLSVLSKSGYVLYSERYYPDATPDSLEGRCAKLCDVKGYLVLGTMAVSGWYPREHIDYVKITRSSE